MKWLTDHYNDKEEHLLQKFTREFSEGHGSSGEPDDDEPDWIRDHYIKTAKSQAIRKLEELRERRRKHDERLENIRRGDSSNLARSRKFKGRLSTSKVQMIVKYN